MKVRNSFVTNSSSTCYILDLREPGVKEALQSTMRVMNEETVWENDTFYDFETETFIDKEKWLIENGYELVENDENRWGNWKTYRAEIDLQNAKQDLGRQTAFCTGNDLYEMIASHTEFSQEYGGHLLEDWLSEYVEKLGEENTLFIRESDEGSGGVLSGEMHQAIKEKALSEMEYH